MPHFFRQDFAVRSLVSLDSLDDDAHAVEHVAGRLGVVCVG